MRHTTRWNLATPHPRADALAQSLRVSPLLAQTLLNRGVETPETALVFLQPSLKTLYDPHLIPGLPRAADRIARAIRDRERIVLYGDYDVDGITGIAILWHAIRRLGGLVEYHIPHRVDDGYGLNCPAIEQLINAGAQLLVTVDCGVTAIEPAALARQRNVDLIVSDHHQWHEKVDAAGESHPHLPDCHSIVHPRLPCDQPEYPNPHLCGAGVAFKLAWGVGQAMSGNARVAVELRDFLIEATALAALGTIADVVPLVGENRTLAHFGLGGLRQSKLEGIRALIASAALTGQHLDSYHVGFLLAPRLNACGRMGHAAKAVHMLTEATPEEALEIAAYLETQNRERQSVERQILEQALAQLEARSSAEKDRRAIVLASDQWHPGVIGIVASRLVDRLCRPVVMIALNNGHGQGSARSVPGFHLAHALTACGEHLLSHGGHEMAAGLKISTDRVSAFAEAFETYALNNVTPEMMARQVYLEADASLIDFTESLVRDLGRLGPFGPANRKPLLCLRNVEVSLSPRVVGKQGNHLQMVVRQGERTLKCIAFDHADLKDRLSAGTRIDLAVEPVLNEFNGRRAVELQVKDVQFRA